LNLRPSGYEWKATGCDYFRSSSYNRDISALCRGFHCRGFSLHYSRTCARSFPSASTALPEFATLSFWKQDKHLNSRARTQRAYVCSVCGHPSRTQVFARIVSSQDSLNLQYPSRCCPRTCGQTRLQEIKLQKPLLRACWAFSRAAYAVCVSKVPKSLIAAARLSHSMKCRAAWR
jgi:hypothetical protein